MCVDIISSYTNAYSLWLAHNNTWVANVVTLHPHITRVVMARILVVGTVLWVVVAAAALSEGYFSAITVQTSIENRSSPNTKCVTIVSRCEHKHSCIGKYACSNYWSTIYNPARATAHHEMLGLGARVGEHLLYSFTAHYCILTSWTNSWLNQLTNWTNWQWAILFSLLPAAYILYCLIIIIENWWDHFGSRLKFSLKEDYCDGIHISLHSQSQASQIYTH